MSHPLNMSAHSQDDVILNVNTSLRNNSTTINSNVQLNNSYNPNNPINNNNNYNSERLGLVANSYQNRIAGNNLGGGGVPGNAYAVNNNTTSFVANNNSGNNDGYYSTGNMRDSSIGAGPGIYEPDTRSIGSTPSKISKFTYSGKRFTIKFI
jgi:hypothetical protein